MNQSTHHPPAPTPVAIAAWSGCIMASSLLLITSSMETLVTRVLVIGICVAAMLVLRIWTAGLVLFFFLLDLFINERPEFILPVSTPPDAIYAVALLVLLISAGRYVGLTGHLVPYEGSITSIIWKRLNYLRTNMIAVSEGQADSIIPGVEAARELNDGMPPRDVSSFQPVELIKGLLRAVLSVALALWLLSLVPASRESYATTQLPPLVLRSIVMAVLLSLLYFVSGGLLSAIVWKTLPPRAGRVYLRSVMARWYHREVRSAVVRQVKERQRRRAKTTDA